MKATLQLGPRGTITLTKRLCEKVGLKSERVVVLEYTDQGILVRPASVFPIENYSDERLDEFGAGNNAAIGGVFPARKR